MRVVAQAAAAPRMGQKHMGLLLRLERAGDLGILLLLIAQPVLLVLYEIDAITFWFAVMMPRVLGGMDFLLCLFAGWQLCLRLFLRQPFDGLMALLFLLSMLDCMLLLPLAAQLSGS